MNDPLRDEAWESESLRLLARNVRDFAILVLDEEGVVRSWGVGAERLFGYREEEIVGHASELLYTPEDRASGVPEEERRQARELGRGPDDRWHVRNDGSRFWSEGAMAPLREGDGTLRGYAKILRDNTAWWQAERSRREAEGRFRAAFAFASVGAAITDSEGAFLETNAAFRALIGYESDQLEAIRLPNLIHADDVAANRVSLGRLVAGEIPAYVNEVRYVRSDGLPVWVQQSISMTRDERGLPSRVIALTEDITRRKLAEAATAEQLILAKFGRETGLAVAGVLPLDQMLSRCAAACVEHLDAAFARIWTVDESGEVLHLRASAGLYTHLDGEHSRVPVGRFKIGQIARDRKPHLTNAVIGDPMVPAQDWAKGEGIVAFAGYPLVVADRLVGVMGMFSRRPLSEATLMAMASVADGIAVGIERKRTEEWLQRQREWLRVTLESIGDAVIATDVHGHITFMNGVAEGLTGWRQDEAVGLDLDRVFRIVDEQTRAGVEGPALRALREGTIVGLANHTILIARDGTERSIDDSAAPIRDESGGVMGAVLIFRDVQEQRASQKALLASEARKTAILQTALDAIITIDARGHIVEWNPAAEAIFGFSQDEVLGREMSALIIPPFLRENHERGLARYLATGEGPVLGRRIEIAAMRSDGTEFPIELAVTRIPEGGPPLFTAHVRDISARWTAERRRDTRLAVTEALATAQDSAQAAKAILRAICEGLSWNLGSMWIVEPQSALIRCVEVWHDAARSYPRMIAQGRGRPLRRGEGLPGRVWLSGQPAWLPDVGKDENFPRAEAAADEGLHGAFAIPIRIGEQVLGVLEFLSDEVREPDPDLLEMMDTIGGQVGQFLERGRTERALRASEEQLRLALDAGRMGTWAWDIRTNAVAWSPGLERIHGREPNTFPGTFEAYQEDIHPEDRDRVLGALGEALDRASDHHIEYRLRLPDGRTRWVETRGKMYLDASGEPARMVGICMDVDERKEGEGRLAEQTRIAESLNRIGVMIAAEHDLARLVEVVTDEATRLIDARYGAFLHNPLDDREESRIPYTTSGDRGDAFAALSVLMTTELSLPTFASEGPVRIPDVAADPRARTYSGDQGPRGGPAVRSYLAVPVISRLGEVFGGLFFGHPDAEVFSDADERLALGIASQTAVAIDNARLYGELQESERRFRQLADAVPQIVWAADGRGQATYFNRRWYEYTGLSPERSLAPDGWRAAVHPDDLPRLEEAAQRSRENQSFEAEYRLRDQNGDYRWHLGRAVFILGEGGLILRGYGTATDIDDRRRSEQTARFLADASAALAGLVDYEQTLQRVAAMAVPAFADWCAVDLKDEDGRLRRVAVTHPEQEKLALAHEIFAKYPPRLDDPMGIGQVIRTGKPELVQEISDAMLETSAHDPDHLRMIRELGLISYICVALTPRGGTPGALTFVTAESKRRYGPDDLLVAEDLAARATVAVENAELYRALREADRGKTELLATIRDSEERFRTMAESIPQLAWMARPDGHIYWYNKRWHDYTGTKPEDMEGWGWQKVHDPAVLPEVLERWQRSIASGEPFDMVFPIRAADGTFRPFLTRVAPVRGDGGEIVHWFGTNTDIADRLRIEEELRAAKEDAEAANRAKSQFLAVLSHELRTPLNPILLAASSMLERPGEPDDWRPTLEMIRQNVNLQARLIDDLLDVMRIVRGKMPLHWEVADAHALIRQALQMCQSELFGKELKLRLDLGASEHFLNADPARFQQVVWNLVKNAVKFTPTGGEVTIRSRNESGAAEQETLLLLEIADTGIGIEPEILPLIFDPFQQGETRITRKFGGLGLGLAICRGIVDAHGGTLTARSPGKDLGTTFRVSLRTIPSPTTNVPAPSEACPNTFDRAPASLRILAVEDEPATLRLMARLLQGLGHIVTTANSIASGQAAIEAQDFDLIVSDVGLPDGSGLELMRRIVALRGRIPAIALTGYGMEEDIRKSREAGFTAHMTKPIDFTKLEAMIAQVAVTRA